MKGTGRREGDGRERRRGETIRVTEGKEERMQERRFRYEKKKIGKTGR